MCKHVAAVFYGVGARLDQKPELLFLLRAVDAAELVTGIDHALPLSKSRPKTNKILAADDMAALFGLDMAEAEPSDQPVDKSKRSKARPGKDKASAATTKRSTSGAQAAQKYAAVAGKVVAKVAALKTMKARDHQVSIKPSKQKLQAPAGRKSHSQKGAAKNIQTNRPPAKGTSGPIVTKKTAVG